MDWKSHIRAAFARGAQMPDDEVIEELAHHARAMYEAARADGCADTEARRRVDVQIELWRSDAGALRHAARRAPVVEAPPAASASIFSGLSHDTRYALRLLRRQPRFALLVILMMALGIGATSTLFSVTYGVLLKPLPWPNADRLVTVKETRGGTSPRFGDVSNAALLAWQQQPTTIDGIEAWSLRTSVLTGIGEPERLRIGAVSAGLFPLLGVRPIVGSIFQPDHEPASGKAASVVVLSESLWRQRFNADVAVLDRIVHLDGQAHVVIGVLADRDAYPDRQTKAWVPFKVSPPTGNFLQMFSAVARLAPGATAQQAAAEGTARGRYVADTGLTTKAIFGGDGPVGLSATPVHDAITADVRRPLLMLLAAVGLLFATAMANVASLQLARATTRHREIAIRAAIGAGGGRLTRQLLIENLVVGLLGGIAGVGVAALLHRGLPGVLPPDFPRIDDLSFDAAVVGFAALASMAAAALCGLLPAIRIRRLNLSDSLAEDGAASVGAGGRSGTARARVLIMSAQVAIACILLVGAALLGRSFVALLKADRGFDPSDVMTTLVSMPPSMYTPERRYAIVDNTLRRLAAVPGIIDAAFTSEMPLTPGGSTTAFTMPSRTGNGGTVWVQASPRSVSPRFFAALGMRIAEGRVFTDDDTATSQYVAVVNRSFARQYLGSPAVGTQIPIAVRPPRADESRVFSTVIGVVEDVRYPNAPTQSQPEIFFSYRQLPARMTVNTVTLLVRTRGDRAATAAAMRTAVREADERLVAAPVATLEERLVRTLARPRLYAILLGGFAGFALIVAAVGLFGVLSYTVAQRSREFAVRAALGARRTDIVALVLRQGAIVTIAGIFAGLGAAAALTRWIGTLLYGVTAHDPVTFVVVPALLSVVALLACLIPARRAAAVDPLRILRGGV